MLDDLDAHSVAKCTLEMTAYLDILDDGMTHFVEEKEGHGMSSCIKDWYFRVA